MEIVAKEAWVKPSVVELDVKGTATGSSPVTLEGQKFIGKYGTVTGSATAGPAS